MSDSNRRDRYALIALALILSAVVIVALFEIGLRHYAVADEVLASQFQLFGDTPAQWTMAVFAVLATAVSWRAVVLVGKTWEEAKRTADAAFEANLTARQIGQAQVRAYLSILGGHYSIWGTMILFGLNIRNSGQSPSDGGSVDWTLVYRERLPSGGDTLTKDREVQLGSTLFGAIAANRDGNPAEGRFSEDDGIEGFFLGATSTFYLRCTVRWKDVFGTPCSQTVLLRGQRDLSYAPAIVGSGDRADSVGSLTVVPDSQAVG